MKKLLLFFAAVLFAVPAAAVCPVCTVAIGAGLTFLEVWGVDLALAGIWAGAFTLVLVFWTAKWMNKRGIKNGFWYLLDVLVWYGFLACVYLLPGFRFGGAGNTIFGTDKLMVGIVAGTIVLYAAETWNAKLLKHNGGKSYFPFQKVVIPFVALTIITAIFAGILYL
ncbi:MAG: hypothetical protein LBL75_04210 [Rickettsiales bacterium]|nr:hypothetical protein [Rickettsiales bacterium]